MNLEFEISHFRTHQSVDILDAIGKDPDWKIFTETEERRNNYIKQLEQSVTFVCYAKNSFCGYVRALLDEGFAIYISELYVKPDYRNNNIGQQLIEMVKEKYDTLSVYALSDEDLYYQKKGYKKIGSIFEI